MFDAYTYVTVCDVYFGCLLICHCDVVIVDAYTDVTVMLL